jgi:uncharacterized membrane protein
MRPFVLFFPGGVQLTALLKLWKQFAAEERDEASR